jgi:hypothetical protein
VEARIGRVNGTKKHAEARSEHPRGEKKTRETGSRNREHSSVGEKAAGQLGPKSEVIPRTGRPPCADRLWFRATRLCQGRIVRGVPTRNVRPSRTDFFSPTIERSPSETGRNRHRPTFSGGSSPLTQKKPTKEKQGRRQWRRYDRGTAEKEAALHAAAPDRRSGPRAVVAIDGSGRIAMIPGGLLGFSLLLSTSTSTPPLSPTGQPAGGNRGHARIERLSPESRSFPAITVRPILPSPFRLRPADQGSPSPPYLELSYWPMSRFTVVHGVWG